MAGYYDVDLAGAQIGGCTDEPCDAPERAIESIGRRVGNVLSGIEAANDRLRSSLDRVFDDSSAKLQGAAIGGPVSVRSFRSIAAIHSALESIDKEIAVYHDLSQRAATL